MIGVLMSLSLFNFIFPSCSFVKRNLYDERMFFDTFVKGNF